MKKSKNTKNYSKKYGSALKGCPILEYKELCIKTKQGGLKKINPLDVTHEGSSFGLILDLYNDLKKSNSEYKNSVGHSISALISLLKAKGYNTPNVELNALIDDINSLVIVEPSKLYNVYHLNADGYVVSSSPILSNDIILEDSDRPDDYANGYWKINDGMWELDKDKFNSYWSVV